MSKIEKDVVQFRRKTYFTDVIVDNYGEAIGSITLNGTTITQWPTGGSGGLVTWSQILGNPYTNTNLANALNAKADLTDLTTLGGNLNTLSSQVDILSDDILILSAYNINNDLNIIYLSGAIDKNKDNISQLRSLSANWQNTYLSYLNNSAYYLTSVDFSQYTPLSTYISTSGVYTTVQNNSATTWNYQGNDLKALSANWQNTSTVVQNYSAQWILSGTDVDLGQIPALSGNWNSVYSTFNSTSSLFLTSVDLTPYTLLSTYAGTSGVYTTVQNNSANWNYQGTDIKALSANWQNTYISYNSTSGLFLTSVNLTNYALASSLSGYTPLTTYAGTSGVWTTVNSNSGTWQTAVQPNTNVLFNTVSASTFTLGGTAISAWPTGGSGGGTWGSITGTLSAQTDLQNSLDAKANVSGQVFTGNIGISAVAPTFTLTSPDDSNNTAEIKRVASSRALTVKNYVGTPSGNPVSVQTIDSQSLVTPTASKYSFTKTTPFSIEFWLAQGVQHYGFNVLEILGQNSTKGFKIYMISGNASSDWGLQFSITDGTNSYNVYNYSINPYSGGNMGIYHFVFVNDGAGNLSIYKNTALQTTTAGGTFASVGDMTTSTGLKITGNTFFTPQIDELVIWNHALTTGEISARYNLGNGLYTVPTSSTLGVYHFETSDITDSSTNPANFSGTNTYALGKVVTPPNASQGTLLNYIDGTNAGEKGIAYIGDASSRTVIQGLTTRFNIGGVEKGQINSTSFNYTLPNIITGSSDVVQSKIIANVTQTNPLFQLLASDGTTNKLSIDANGYFKRDTYYLLHLLGGTTNFSAGYRAGESLSSGTGNTLIGNLAGKTLASTNYTTAVGYFAGNAITGSYNSIFGSVAGNLLSSGTNNIFIGFSAGRYQTTLSNTLIIDNMDRTNASNELSNALIVGTFNATPINQSLKINGVVLPIQAPTASAPAYVKGGIYFDTTLNKLRVGGATAWETITSV